MSYFRLSRLPAMLTGVLLLNLIGCSDAPTTYPTQGKVVLPKGDVRQLAGGILECRLENETRATTFGNIAEDGSFQLQTLHRGKRLNGAPAGAYKARIVIDRDSDQGRVALDPRFASFDSSGLSLQVPATGELTVTLAAGSSSSGGRGPGPKPPTSVE